MNLTDTIKRVQTALGLTADGVAGPLTWAAIANKLAPTTEMPIPSTLDSRTEKHLLTLDPKAVPAFRRFILAAKALAAQSGCDYIGISGNRSWAEQDALYAKGRTAPGPKVTNAKGGQSNHNFGIAMDFGVFKDGKYLDDADPAAAEKIHSAVATLAKAEGLEWGGTWKFRDTPHFEFATGLSLAEKRERFARYGSVL